MVSMVIEGARDCRMYMARAPWLAVGRLGDGPGFGAGPPLLNFSARAAARVPMGRWRGDLDEGLFAFVLAASAPPVEAPALALLLLPLPPLAAAMPAGDTGSGLVGDTAFFPEAGAVGATGAA